MQERSLPMPSQAGKAMNEAMARMKMAGQSAAGGQGRQAGDQGQAAQAALNQAAMALMQSAGQSGGSSGSGDMMEDLEGMSSRQQALNQQTGPMADQQSELQLQAMQGQIPRLAAEQAAIRQGLQEFNQRYGDRTDRAGRLDDLAPEMQKVIDDLKRGAVSRETQQRQEKILTRMLDAQRSLQERDVSRQRQAQPGKEAGAARTAGPARPAVQYWNNHPLWQNWRNEQFPLEYQQMLENYFKSLGQ